MPRVELLDSKELIKKIDRGGMLAVVAQMPEMLLQAEKFSAGVTLPVPEKIAQVLVVGMGGSAIAGDIAADIFFKKSRVPILTSRSYNLPEHVGPDAVLFALSYSGETEEVLSAVREAEKRGAKVVCITSGGKLRELAESKRYPLFLVPSGYQPRVALPFLLVSFLSGLRKLGVIAPQEEEIREAVSLLPTLRDECGPAKHLRSNPAKQLAKKLAGRVPIIFGSTGTTGAAALRFKTQLNENSKMTAVASLFPELDHNEIVNLSVLKKDAHDFSLVVLRDEEDHERVKKRIEITKSLVTRQLGGVSEISSRGRSKLARILSLVFVCDLVSIYLALLQEIDPTPVEVISRLKKELMR